MKYTQIQKYFEKLGIFSITDIRLMDPSFSSVNISNWKKAGYILPVIRGFYIYHGTKINRNFLFRIATTIYSPAYISLESAFSYYGIIPEQVFEITAVSSNKTMQFTTNTGRFWYKKIQPKLYWWYKVVPIEGGKFLIAEIEKAILDYLYLSNKARSIIDFEGLRINKEEVIQQLNPEKFLKYANMFKNATLLKTAHLFLDFVQKW